MGAGLGCPDWPLCHGELFPPWDLLTYIEWGHRFIASLVSLCTLGLVIIAIGFKRYRSSFGLMAVGAFLLLLIQASLGGLAVLSGLSPYVVSIHLAVGLLFLSALLMMRLRLSSREGHNDKKKHPSPLFFLLITTLVIVYAQSLLGGYVASSHAGLACPDFPMCLGRWVPPLTVGVAPHFFHRIGSVVTLLFVITTVGVALRTPLTRGLKTILSIIGIVALTQALLGVSNVIFQLPVIIRIAHLGGATLLFGLLFVAAFEVHHARVS